MNSKSIDKAISRLLRRRAANDLSSKDVQSLKEKLDTQVKRIPEDQRTSVTKAFQIVSDHCDKTNRFLSSEYVSCLKDLLQLGFQDSATTVFLTCITAVGNTSLELLAEAIPNDSCVNQWIKYCKPKKTAVMELISESHLKYYGTALCEWYVTKAKIKDLLPFALLALQERARPNYLPHPSKLLAVILSRDRKFVLSNSIRHRALQDISCTKMLILASSSVSSVGESFASSIGRGLSINDEMCKILISALRDLIHNRERNQSKFASQFAAHVSTSWCLSVNSQHPPNNYIEKALTDLALDVWLVAQENRANDLWLACASQRLAERIHQEQGKISTHGAMQIALGLRSAETDAAARDALWSTAFNLGIKEIGEVSIVIPFDPLIHEDIKGGLLRGDYARIIRCGWKLDETVLLRAQVEPK